MAAVGVGVLVAHGVALARRGARRWWPLPAAAAAAGALLAPDGDRAPAVAAGAVAVAALVWLFRTRTRVGLATASLADDPRPVALLGRNPRRLAALHVAAGTLVAGAGATADGGGAALGAAAAATAVVLVLTRRPRRRTPVVATGEPGTVLVDHVVVRDGGATVLDGVTVLVEPGEVVGVVGPVGAGTSTVLGVVTGRVAADEGAVRVGGDGTVAVFDQPAAGLDDEAALSVHEQIRGHADGGAAVLVAERDLDFALATCDRIIALDRGRAVASGPPAEVRIHPAVVAAYLGRRRDEVAS
jgi:ABC-type multidrug transport system fused ATPase/permease subunit